MMVGSDECYVLPRHVSTNHPDAGAPLTREHLVRAYVRIDQADDKPVATFRLATCHGDEPVDYEWNFAQFKDRIGAGWDTDVGRLEAENERLRALRDACAAYFDNPMEVTVNPVLAALDACRGQEASCP